MIQTLTADIETRAQTALTSSTIHAMRELQVEQRGPKLLLSGRVSSFYHKQVAQELVRGLTGELQLVNQIEVD